MYDQAPNILSTIFSFVLNDYYGLMVLGALVFGAALMQHWNWSVCWTAYVRLSFVHLNDNERAPCDTRTMYPRR